MNLKISLAFFKDRLKHTIYIFSIWIKPLTLNELLEEIEDIDDDADLLDAFFLVTPLRTSQTRALVIR